MIKRSNKLEELKNLGWSKKDVLQLVAEVIDMVWDDEIILTTKSTDQLITDTLKSWGFSFSHMGTNYLKDLLKSCLERNSANILLKDDLYVALEEKYGITYENTRSNIRDSIKSAFKSPTLLAMTVFGQYISKRGYPTIKEFILEAYNYLLVASNTAKVNNFAI